MPCRKPLRICMRMNRVSSLAAAHVTQSAVAARQLGEPEWEAHELGIYSRDTEVSSGYPNPKPRNADDSLTSAERSPTWPGLLGMKMVEFLAPTSCAR